MSTTTIKPTILRNLVTLVLGLLLFATFVSAHEHHDEEAAWNDDNPFTNDEPIDEILKWHIGIQMTAWSGFCVGMVLGINKSRWHVPLQSLCCVLTFCGNFLGHHHKGRSFHSTAHGHFASYLKWYLIIQTGLGIYLKLHIMEGTKVRRSAVMAHGVIGKSFPVMAWVQFIFGGIAALGFCFGEHFGQCLAHFIMGSAFIGYAMILLLMLRVGAGWLLRREVSQEFLDSTTIGVWGIVNTFTEHDAMTGYAMSGHAQSLEFSTSVHKLFGFCLMAAGVARIIEICFVLKDAPSPEVTPEAGPRAFQHLTPFLLVLSGLTFLSATEEQMKWISDSGMDPITYANILFSTSFVIYLAGNALLELFERTRKDPNAPPRQAGQDDVERGRMWYGIPVPDFNSFLSGRGASPEHDNREHYESVPLTGSAVSGGATMAEGNGMVFDLGEEESEEDDGGDKYWSEEREKGHV
ncbi:integral membrane protein [Pseudohyphozyma bogoriensis]|nr:integral membrane protein [Pseudohyphozyma bogoriensis]